MLSESFVVSTQLSGKTPASSALKDVGVCIHELQPTSALRSTFKKTSTATNCLAVTPAHIYAAQAEKAVVHVYSRLRGNQEATVPFPERIRSIAAAGGANGEILVLGTEGGRLILWETCTGRQVSTAAAHLQPVTCLVVDPTSNFILSGSSDANVHVWSLPQLLSFSKPESKGPEQKAPNSPLNTFSNHRGAITALAVGHSTSSSNIAISAAKDNTVVVWQYQQGLVLRTYLLSSTAVSLALDPADRALYVGYETGNLQMVDFYETPSIQAPLFNKDLQSTPCQIPGEQQWRVPAETYGPALSLAVSYDGTKLLSGHQNGSILSWDVGRRKYTATVADYTHPITNLQMLPPEGFVSSPPSSSSASSSFTIHNIVKPRYDQKLSDSAHSSDSIPFNYTFNAQLTPTIATTNKDDIFTTALHHPSFPTSLIEEGLAELHALRSLSSNGTSSTITVPTDADAISSHSLSKIDQGNGEDSNQQKIESLENEITHLKQRLQTNETARRSTTDELVALKTELRNLQDYAQDLHMKRERERMEYLGGKGLSEEEKRDLKRREAWFDAERRKPGSGDGVVRRMKQEDEKRNLEKGIDGDVDMM